MGIQLLLLVAVVATSVFLLRGWAGARHQALRRVLLVGFASAAVVSLLFPESWSAMADALGVGRGTDLLLYALIVAFLGYVATSYLRMRALQQQMTVLARRLALDEVAPPARTADGSPVLPVGIQPPPHQPGGGPPRAPSDAAAERPRTVP